MARRVVFVHDDAEFAGTAASALRDIGCEVTVFSNPLDALTALDSHHYELLITRIRFPEGQPHGVSLALVGKTRQPGLKVVFTALPQFAAEAEGIGTFLPAPIVLSDLVATVVRHLGRGS